MRQLGERVTAVTLARALGVSARRARRLLRALRRDGAPEAPTSDEHARDEHAPRIAATPRRQSTADQAHAAIDRIERYLREAKVEAAARELTQSGLTLETVDRGIPSKARGPLRVTLGAAAARLALIRGRPRQALALSNRVLRLARALRHPATIALHATRAGCFRMLGGPALLRAVDELNAGRDALGWVPPEQRRSMRLRLAANTITPLLAADLLADAGKWLGAADDDLDGSSDTDLVETEVLRARLLFTRGHYLPAAITIGRATLALPNAEPWVHGWWHRVFADVVRVVGKPSDAWGACLEDAWVVAPDQGFQRSLIVARVAAASLSEDPTETWSPTTLRSYRLHLARLHDQRWGRRTVADCPVCGRLGVVLRSRHALDLRAPNDWTFWR